MELPFEVVERWVQESKKKLKPIFCDLGEIVEGAKVLKDKNATSDSMFLIGTYSVRSSMESMRGTKAFCKIAFRMPYQEDDSSEYEIVLYSYLSNLERRTPNITKFYQSFVCPRFFESYQPIPKEGGGYYSKAELLFSSFGYLDKSPLKNLIDCQNYSFDNVVPEDDEIRVLLRNSLDEYEIMREEIEKIENQITNDELMCTYALLQKVVDRVNYYDAEVNNLYIKRIEPLVENDDQLDLLQARFLIMEALDGLRLADFTFEDVNYDYFVDIIFQVCYTIREMRLYGVRHNDLHDANVIAIGHSDPTVYFVDRDKYYVSRGYRAKILDFDRATLTKKGQENPSSREYCKKYGQCTFPSERYDIYVLIKSIWFSVEDEAKAVRLIEFFEKIIDKQLLKTKKKETLEVGGIEYFCPWHNRICVNKNGSCDPEVDIGGVKTFDEMLQEGLFKLSDNRINDVRNVSGITDSNIYVSKASEL